MIKKILIFSCCMILQSSLSVFAATQLKVSALENFSTISPNKDINVKILEDAFLGDYFLEENTVLHCQLSNIVEPKRGKRNASFYVKPISYTDNYKTFEITDEMYGKYSIKRLSKEELKKIKPTNVLKKTALTVGGFFVKGLSTAYSFGEGIVKNEKDNRLKSGVVNAYEQSPLSYINEGEQLKIHPGDVYYLVFKVKDKSKKQTEELYDVDNSEIEEDLIKVKTEKIKDLEENEKND